MIETGLSILNNLIESFALLVSYLEKVIRKVNWQMRAVMIGHI